MKNPLLLLLSLLCLPLFAEDAIDSKPVKPESVSRAQIANMIRSGEFSRLEEIAVGENRERPELVRMLMTASLAKPLRGPDPETADKLKDHLVARLDAISGGKAASAEKDVQYYYNRAMLEDALGDDLAALHSYRAVAENLEKASPTLVAKIRELENRLGEDADRE